jgi:energy-coupling factor transporter transmembrane protein EcfT
VNGWRWLIRASLWARNPPSAKKVMFFGAILLVCLTIGFVEHYIGWPDWAQRDRLPRVPR